MKRTARRKVESGGRVSSRRFVRLTRAHLEMSGRLTGCEDNRYAITALCVRRAGDAVIAEATNGRIAWRYPAEWVNAAGLPASFAGEELADGQRILLDAETVKLCKQALPKMQTPDDWKSAYLSVNADGIGVLSTFSTARFLLTHYDKDARWPNFDEIIPERVTPCVTLCAEELARITAWVNEFAHENASEKPLTLSFFPYQGVVGVRLNVERDDGPIGVLAPIKTRGGLMHASMPAWLSAFAEGSEILAEQREGKGVRRDHKAEEAEEAKA